MSISLKNPGAEIFVPDGVSAGEALKRTTIMAIGGHPDDLEIMAFDGILKCFQRQDRWFTGVVLTDGAGSSRTDVYNDYTDEQMCLVRRKEQRKAAVVGEYSAQVLMDYSSGDLRDPSNDGPVLDLVGILEVARPKVIYTHNLADKHDTHVAAVCRVIKAIRSLPKGSKPDQLLGCEVWRNLDWLVDDDKVNGDVSEHENLQASLLGIFDSQVTGGKRYDLAAMGRRKANATFYESHNVDETHGLSFSMDLTPMIRDEDIDPSHYVQASIDRFAAEVKGKIVRFWA